MKKRQRKHKSNLTRLERRLAKKYPDRNLKDILNGGSKHAGGKTKPKGWKRALRNEKKRERNARKKNR